MVESKAMNLHIDKAGRIVLPKAIRQQLGITPDSPLELVPSADGVLLRRVADKPMMRQIDGVWVHQGASTATADADWSNIVDSSREERAIGVWPA
jgi:AbrB family looped-hinge helix DNA binding protein